MNLTEATALVRTIKAVCPSQQIDSFAADAWEMALYDIRAADAAEAVKRIVRRELEPGKARYIEPGHIRFEVRRLRDERIEKYGELEPPRSMPESEHREWYRKARERIADGEIIERPVLEVRPMPDLRGLLRSVDDAADDEPEGAADAV